MAGVARFSIRFRYAIIGGWLVAAALCVTLLPSLASAINTDNSSFLPASAPSQQAMDLAEPFQPAGTTAATLVVAGKSTLTTSDQNAITSLEGKIAKDDHVVSVSDQGLSKDGEASKAQVVVNVLTSSTDASPTVAAIRATISSGGLPAGVTGYLTGQLPTAVDNQNSQASAQRLTEQLSALVILVMLAVVYRSVLAPLVTLGTAELVLQISGRIIAQMSTAGLQVSTVTQTMLVVLLLGAGTDYGLFLVLRVREEMAGGAAPHAAIERAGRYIGESITFSAGTVIVALLCLLLASFGLYSGLGPALALGVAIMLLAALTLIPALIAVLGRSVFWPRPIRPARREGLWARLADVVIAHPVTTLVLGVVFLGALSVFAAGYTSSGFGGTTTGPPGSGSAAGTNVINNHYPAAVANPTTVLMVYKSSVWANLTPVQQAESDLGGKTVFASVTGLLNPNGTAVSTQQLESLYSELGPPGKLPATQAPGSPVSAQQYASYRASAQFVSPDGKTVQFYTSLTAGSPSTSAALNAVPAMRTATDSVQHAAGATDSGVSGLAPSSYDVNTVSHSDLVDDRPGGARPAHAAARPAAAQRGRPAVPGRHRPAQLLRRAGHRGPDLPGRRGRLRAQLRAAVPAVRFPDGARRGLQHPGHEPHPRGGTQGAAAPGRRHRGASHRHHRDVGRADPRRHLRRGRHHRRDQPDQATQHGDRARRADRHLPRAHADGPGGRGHLRAQELVAVAARAPGRHAPGRRR